MHTYTHIFFQKTISRNQANCRLMPVKKFYIKCFGLSETKAQQQNKLFPTKTTLGLVVPYHWAQDGVTYQT